MKFFNNLSLQLKLIVSCVSIVLLSVVMFAAVIFARSASVVQRLAERNAEQVIESASQHTAALIDDIDALLLSFQTKETVQDILSDPDPERVVADVETLEGELRELDIFQSKISRVELYALGRDDFPAIGSDRRVFSDKQLKNDVWYNTVLRSESETKWLLRDNHDPGQAVLVASKLIHDVYSRKPVAIISASIDLPVFTEYLDNVTLADTGKIFLCSDSHIVDHSASALGTDLTNHPVIVDTMLKSAVPETRKLRLNGDDWLVKSYPLQGTGLFLLSAVKIDEFSSAQSSIGFAIVTTGVALLILSLALVMLISSLITKPLLTLTHRMNNYNIENNNTLHPDSTDEIGILFEAFNSMNEQIHTLIENLNRETQTRKVAEMKALQAQITPHFLYNTLNSISALSKSCGAKNIEQMTLALSRFFRHSLNNGAEMICIGDELEQVMSYVYIQKIRYGDKFDVVLQVEEELKHYLICKLTLQPLVENCIYHAFREIDDMGIITIKAVKEGEFLLITVSDNGIGGISADLKQMNEYVNRSFDPDEAIEKYGIHNIAQRIRLYFGEDCGLSYSLSGEGDGLCATIRIKAIKKQG